MAFSNDLGSVSCAHLGSFVMRSASSGTPGSHTFAGNFPVTRHTVAHGYTTVSFTPTLSSGSKMLFVLDEQLTSTESRNGLREESWD